MRRVASFLLRVLLVFVVVEGAASLAMFAIQAAVEFRSPLAERQHTRYDAELGWVNVPGARIPDMYGPGVGLSINAQGFRGPQELAAQVPAGRQRTICLGDSFTLGYGVADAETWCAQLASLDARREGVNMGQGGYGLDQAYLWYRRDAAGIDHQLVIFAFIAEDFRRMQSDSFFGYGKPVLRVEEGELVTQNVPVPERGYLVPWVSQNLELLGRLRSLELVRMLGGAGSAPSEAIDETLMQQLTGAIFADLLRLTAERGSRLVLVYLPTRGEYASSYLDGWRELAAAHAASVGAPFIDLVPPLRRLSPEALEGLFIPAGALTYPAAAGHYTVEGNAWVARQIHDRLPAIDAAR